MTFSPPNHKVPDFVYQRRSGQNIHKNSYMGSLHVLVHERNNKEFVWNNFMFESVFLKWLNVDIVLRNRKKTVWSAIVEQISGFS